MVLITASLDSDPYALDVVRSCWKPFKQGFIERYEVSRSFVHHTMAIETEALRRGKYDASEVTALFSRL